MRLLVVGAGGKIGAECVMAGGEAVVGCRRQELDIAERGAVVSALRTFRPKVVVNAAAATDLERAEADPDYAFRANALGAKVLARACAEAGVALVHLSTDSVFGDDNLDTPRLETDVAHPLSVYGQSKLRGEQLVQASGARHLILRVSWVFGPRSGGFVPAVVQRVLAGETVEVVARQRGCPTPVEAVVEAVLRCAELLGGARVEPGIYHFCSSEAVSRPELAVQILTCLRELGVTCPDGPRVIEAGARDRARRPVNSVLDCFKFTRSTGLSLPAWRMALRETVRQLVQASGGRATSPGAV